MKLHRRFFRTRAGIALLAVTALVLLFAVVAALRPLPSRRLAMATGLPGSAYARAGEQYRALLARDGVQLRLVPTNGALANEGMLRDAGSGVSVGFVQAGVSGKPPSGLLSLGTVFYEPLWFFCRCAGGGLPQTHTNLRISIGPEGSASRPLALRLLALNGITRPASLPPLRHAVGER